MNKIGKFGEDVACLFLKKHGYKVVERNYLKKWGELDIVASKKGILCFVEVKTIKDVTHGTFSDQSAYRPEENMSAAKLKKLSRIVQTYLQDKGKENVEWSAALIAIRVDMSKKVAKVRFIDNILLK